VQVLYHLAYAASPYLGFWSQTSIYLANRKVTALFIKILGKY
jgi:hypothetical protein